MELLIAGHLCRGFVNRGRILHSDKQFIGTGYQNAVEGEKRVSIFQADSVDRGTPFIQIDRSVCEYVAKEADPCVKEMFGRMTECDGRETAVSPFSALKKIPATVIDRNFDPVKWKATIATTQANIQRLLTQLEKTEIGASDSAKGKIAHYKRKLTEILEVKEKERATMDRLSGAFPVGA
jgi:hypothetical protein